MPGGRILDVATGGGSCIEWLVQGLPSYDAIIGVDNFVQPGKTSIFERDHIHFMQMDAHHLAFADASFDIVSIARSLHHMADPRRVLAEMHRVLKPGGHCIIREMYRDHQTEAQMTHVAMHDWWADIDTALGVVHNKTFTRQRLVEMAEQMGLSRLAFYDYADLDGDRRAPARIQELHVRHEQYLERAKNLPDIVSFQERGAALARRLDEIGILNATLLIVIGEK